MPEGGLTKNRVLVNKDVPADGSCFFSSVGSLLYLSSHNDSERSGKDLRRFCRNLRKVVADEVLKNSERYKFHLKEEVGCTPEKYASLIVHSNVWGGYVDAAILSTLYNVNMIILALDSRKGEFFTLKIGNFTNSVAIQYEQEHYNYLLTDDDGVYVNLEEVNNHGEKWKAAQKALRERSKIRPRPEASEVCQVSSDEPEDIPDKIVVNSNKNPPPYQEESRSVSNEKERRVKDSADNNLANLKSEKLETESGTNCPSTASTNSKSDQPKTDGKVSDEISSSINFTSSTSSRRFSYRRYNPISMNESGDRPTKDGNFTAETRRNLHLNLEDSDSDVGATVDVNENLTRSPLDNIHLWSPGFNNDTESRV